MWELLSHENCICFQKFLQHYFFDFQKKLLQSSDYDIFVKIKWKRAILFSWQCIVNTVLSNFPGLLQKHIMAEVLSKNLVSQSVSIFNLSSKASN